MPTYTGNGNNNVITGSTGDDDIFGLGGDDVLIGIGGNDTLDGGTGADTMDGGSGNDTYIVDNVNDEVVEYANKGKDTIKSSVTYSLNFAQNVENLMLTGTADIDAYGDNSINGLFGNSGNNILWAAGGNDTLKGGGGDDHLNGGAGHDKMYGGTGNDDYVVTDSFDEVTEYDDQGIDTVFTSHDYYTLGDNLENLVLTGWANSHGKGNELNNELAGNSGNNTLWGGDGADTMQGGEGDDTYFVDQSGDEVIEYADEGNDLVYSQVSIALDDNIENLILTGGNVVGTGNELDNWMTGSAGNNLLFGNDGDDTIDGKEGNDTMYGGEGHDVFGVDSQDDKVVEYDSDGADAVYLTGDFDYELADNLENLYFVGAGARVGNETNNIISFSVSWDTSDNTLDGGLGQDEMHGGAGNDNYYVDSEEDLAIEEDAVFGTQDVVYSTVNYTIGDHIEVLSLDGGNAVFGTGNAQSNTIFGNLQDNVLDGGGSSDSLSGLGGNDTFVFNVGQANGDVVYEFNGNGAGLGDTLKFVGYGPGAILQQLTASEWRVSSADGAIQEIFTLVGAPALDPSDYMFA
jgi:Ca2+-binding RTX toxin-like protein